MKKRSSIMAVESARRHLPGAAGATGTAACAFEAETFEAFESGEPLGNGGAPVRNRVQLGAT